MRYNVEEFFEKNRDLGYSELIDAADRAATDAKREAYSGKPGSVAARDAGAEEFLGRMREILNFLRYNQKPFMISPRDWDLCRTLTQRFVDRGILKPQLLELWDAN